MGHCLAWRAGVVEPLVRPAGTAQARVRPVGPGQPQPAHRASAMSGPGRFLIVSWDGGGNAPPAINLGARLVRRGHHVRLLGWESMASRAAAAGVEFAAYPSVPAWPPGLAFEEALEERLLPALARRGDAGRHPRRARTGSRPTCGGGLHDGRRTGGGSRCSDCRVPCWSTCRTPRSGTSGATRRRARRRPASSTRRAPCWRSCRRASTRPARCRPTPPMSARSPIRTRGRRWIRVTPACWPRLAAHGCCSASARPCRGRPRHCPGSSTPSRRCRSGCC